MVPPEAQLPLSISVLPRSPPFGLREVELVSVTWRQIRDFYVHRQHESGLGREGLTSYGAKPQVKPRGSLADPNFTTMMKSETEEAKEGICSFPPFLRFAKVTPGSRKTSPTPQVHATRREILRPENSDKRHPS